jgi:putative tricarboxylic transport membrane protein
VRGVPGVALPLAAAAVIAATALLWIAPGVDVAAMSRGVIGPTTWPKAMLLAAAACAAFLALERVLFGLKAESPSPAVDYHEGRSAGAMALVIAYGVAIPVIGIAWSTPLFIAGWLLLGGLRAPLTVALVSVLGTVGLLYFFVKLSLMPLDRGKGVFEQATVALYRLLGIY